MKKLIAFGKIDGAAIQNIIRRSPPRLLKQERNMLLKLEGIKMSMRPACVYIRRGSKIGVKWELSTGKREYVRAFHGRFGIPSDTWKGLCFDKYVELMENYRGVLNAEEAKIVKKVIREYNPKITRERFINEFRNSFPDIGLDDSEVSMIFCPQKAGIEE